MTDSGLVPTGPNDSFDAVLAAAQQGDPTSLGELWQRYNAPLVRYLRVAGGEHNADDLASRTWIDAATGLSRFQGDEAGFRGWLFTIARRRLTDDLRRHSRRPETLRAEVPEQPNRAHAAFDQRDELETAMAMVGRLSPDQAEAVLLRIVAGLDVTAVAALMQRSEGSVRVLTHRGLHRLAELLTEDASPTEVISRSTVTPPAALTMKGSR